MLKNYVHKIFTLPPHITAKKAVQKTANLAKDKYLCARDKRLPTYFQKDIKGELSSYFPKLAAEQLLPYAETISGVTKHYLAHRFDLLGSGWMQVKHGMRCRGLEGHRYDMGAPVDADPEGRWLEERINLANLEESKRIWKLIFHNQLKTQNSKLKTYTPIDWHLDFKSGYRWLESIWYQDIRYGHKPGVDVKVPWEMERMQHLPQLTFTYGLASFKSYVLNFKEKKNGIEIRQDYKEVLDLLEPPERYTQEFRNQVLDFIATNLPRFGVNWACTMDLAIRVANWLVAYDLFSVCGAEFDEEFKKIFIRSVYEHGLHIVNNLEWNEELRSNFDRKGAPTRDLL